MTRKSVCDNAHDAAVAYAGRSARTSGEVREHLRSMGFDDEEIGSSIERLKEIFLLDDMDFAKEFVESRLRTKPISRRKLEMQLRAHMLDKDTICVALSVVDDNIERENAATVVHNNCANCSSQENERRKCSQKLIGRLLNNGFNYETAKTAVERECRACPIIED